MLLLGAVFNEGPGIFHRVMFIQRVNTVGGNAPTDPRELPRRGDESALHRRVFLLPGARLTLCGRRVAAGGTVGVPPVVFR